MTEAQSDLLAPSSVARMLGVAHSTVIGWANTGKLSARRDSVGRRLFRLCDVEQFAGSRQQTTASEKTA